MPCSTSISGSGSGLHNQFKKWLATINTLDAQNALIAKKVSVVTISDISKQFSESEKVLQNYNKLENFIDHFPFGIFYINNAGEIINYTLNQKLRRKMLLYATNVLLFLLIIIIVIYKIYK